MVQHTPRAARLQLLLTASLNGGGAVSGVTMAYSYKWGDEGLSEICLSCGGRRPSSGERQSRRGSGRGQRQRPATENGPSTPRNGFVRGRVRRPHFPHHRWQGRIDCPAVLVSPLADSYSANPSPAAPARAFALKANAYLTHSAQRRNTCINAATALSCLFSSLISTQPAPSTSAS